MLNDSLRQEVQQLTRKGLSGRKISQLLGIDVKTVQKVVKVDPSGTLSSKRLNKKLNIVSYVEPNMDMASRRYMGTRACKIGFMTPFNMR